MSFGDSVVVAAKVLAMVYDGMSDFTLCVCDDNVLKKYRYHKVRIFIQDQYCIIESLYCVYVHQYELCIYIYTCVSK